MGPPIRKDDCTSVGFVKKLMLGQMPMIMSSHCCAVDVRDVAQAHLLAIKKEEAANRRFIVCESSPSFKEYCGPIAEKYRPLGWPITDKVQEDDPNEYVSLFDNTASKELGVVYHDFKQTMLDMADRMVELGIVVKPESQ